MCDSALVIFGSIAHLTSYSSRFIVSALLNGKGSSSLDIPKQVDQFLLEQLVSEQLGGFLLILSGTGKIIFVSSSVENLLGHLQVCDKKIVCFQTNAQQAIKISQ